MKLSPVPTAVFAANDRMAAGLLQGLSDAEVDIPGDISIMGYDDSDIAVMTKPMLSTVRIPFFEIGQASAIGLIGLLNNGQGNGINLFIKPGLVVRESTIKPKNKEE